MTFEHIKWIFRGKPTKKIIGGWCGLCGAWLPEAEFVFPDYWQIDNFYDLNTICPDGCKQVKKYWYGVCGETIEEVKRFGAQRPTNFNMDFLEYCETPQQAFKKFWTRKCKSLEKQLEKAKNLSQQ